MYLGHLVFVARSVTGYFTWMSFLEMFYVWQTKSTAQAADIRSSVGKLLKLDSSIPVLHFLLFSVLKHTLFSSVKTWPLVNEARMPLGCSLQGARLVTVPRCLLIFCAFPAVGWTCLVNYGSQCDFVQLGNKQNLQFCVLRSFDVQI